MWMGQDAEARLREASLRKREVSARSCMAARLKAIDQRLIEQSRALVAESCFLLRREE